MVAWFQMRYIVWTAVLMLLVMSAVVFGWQLFGGQPALSDGISRSESNIIPPHPPGRFLVYNPVTQIQLPQQSIFAPPPLVPVPGFIDPALLQQFYLQQLFGDQAQAALLPEGLEGSTVPEADRFPIIPK